MVQLKDLLDKEPRLSWLRSENIRPYVFARPENRSSHPGVKHPQLGWFEKDSVFLNPLRLSGRSFGEQILRFEGRCFGPTGMPMPRWVFYDCALIPGLVTGFAIRTEALSVQQLAILQPEPGSEWSPLSLFIIIPSRTQGEWVAHNLCSLNTILDKDEQFYGLGFLSKAFGLWYSNAEVCCGFFQWSSPALRLHVHYGELALLTAYTPLHTHSSTLAYRLQVRSAQWPHFFDRNPATGFHQKFEKSHYRVGVDDEDSQRDLQNRIERGEGPFYLNPADALVRPAVREYEMYVRRPIL